MFLHLGSGNGQCFVPREKIADTVTNGSMGLVISSGATCLLRYLRSILTWTAKKLKIIMAVKYRSSQEKIFTIANTQ
jgi:hypothetical protein